MNQEEVWNKIAPEWNEFRKPGREILKFIKGLNGKVLDFGCGSGNYLSKIKDGKMYLVDFSEEMIKLARINAKKRKIDAKFFVSDLAKTPFKSNFFDSAISIASIHCIPTKGKRKNALKELFRILKSGAIAKIAVWSHNSEFFKNKPKEKFIAWRDKGKRYYYLYDLEEFKKLLESVGFDVLSINEGKNIIAIVKKP